MTIGKNGFGTKYGTKNINNDFFEIEQILSPRDILILDIDQFSTIGEVMDIFNTIPKSLKVIALLEQPKLAHGAYFIKKVLKAIWVKKQVK